MRNVSKRMLMGFMGVIAVGVAILSKHAYADSPRIQNPDNGHWYQRIDTGMTWHDARDHCASLGGHLATVTSSAEDQFVYNSVGASGGEWLGATDEGSEGDWRWVTGEPWNYTNWAPHEPTNGAGAPPPGNSGKLCLLLGTRI